MRGVSPILAAAFAAGTISNAGSVSKLVTATAITELAEEGKVDLDAPVAHYLPGFAPGTIRRPSGKTRATPRLWALPGARPKGPSDGSRAGRELKD